MKKFIIAAQTLDGFIAKDSNQFVDWTSPADKKHFREITKRAGIMVMGSRTYETIGKPLPGRRTIVMSRTKKYEGVETTNETPEEIVKRLEKEGAQELAICGGQAIYTAFMEADLVDTIYITIEPLFFGNGVPLFSRSFDKKLKLVESKAVDNGPVMLEYEVIRNQ